MTTTFVKLAQLVGERCGPHAARHDLEGTFVAEAYEAMADTGYLRMAVPEELGGMGATVREVAEAEAELARHCTSSALAAAMHLYNTFVLRHRYQKGAADAEAALRRVATEGLVVATSGGSDWLWPTTVAVPVEGGYRVSGRKAFCSQSSVAGVLTTSAVVGEPGPGAEVLHFPMPLTAGGVTIVETWDTLGMRGTASHDLVVDDVFVPEERILERRPWGHLGGGLQAAMAWFAPIVGAVYWGAASAARDLAVQHVAAKGESPLVRRQVGLMDARLRVAWWALLGALDEVGDAMTPGPATTVTVMTAKRECVLAAQEVVDLAVDLVGGSSFYRTSPLERLHRDVRAGRYHPLNPDATLVYSGTLTLGGDTTVA